MKSVARSYFWWIDKAIEEVARNCQACQAIKNTPAVAAMGLAFSTLEKSTPRFCRAFPRHVVFSGGGRSFEVA